MTHTYIIKTKEVAHIERTYLVEAESEEQALNAWSELNTDKATDVDIISKAPEFIVNIREESKEES